MKCKKIIICAGTGCISCKSLEIAELIEKELIKREVAGVKIVKTGCFGLCSRAPMMILEPDGCFYTDLKLEDIPEIVTEHIIGEKPIERLQYKDENGKPASKDEANFFKKQMKIALRRCSVVDPKSIDDFIQEDGFKALEKVLGGMTSDDVINMITESGLRGRGGAGFSTGKKWGAARRAKGERKFIVCNADEGDPGSFMDRCILEGDPFSVIEAMAIAGFAVGAEEGFVYIRKEYALAVDRIKNAISQAKERGFLGENILGSGFSFNISLTFGTGAFVSGESTAICNTIEGKRGLPRVKPPSMAVKGIFGCPTVINNVETLANVGNIILRGTEWFASIGTYGSSGTKVFALGGNVENIGLIEVPMGTTLREIIFDIGGGIPDGKNFKSAQIGGPSGGCVPKEYLDVRIDFDSLEAIGSMMGSGSLIVIDDSNCIVNMAKFFMEFIIEESCGKCPPCRIGAVRIYELLTKITDGKGEQEDLDELSGLCDVLKELSFCGLGKTAANPVLSTLKYFREEYLAHVNEKKCPAGVCAALFRYEINENCIGCTRCSRGCPASAISGKVKQLHNIDGSKCIKCGACLSVCSANAIVKV